MHRLSLFAFILGVFLSLQTAAQTPDSQTPSQLSQENWGSLDLHSSKLYADEPLATPIDDETSFTRELIQVKWRAGDDIDLYVIKPKDVARPPAIIYLYGYPTETDRFRDNDYCRRLTHGGFAAIGFVPAMTGHRYHSRPMKQWFVSELQEALVTSAHDVQMMINYLGQRGDLDLSSLAIFGEGAGGSIAVLAATVEPRIKIVDLLDPWGDWPDWTKESARIPDNERPNYVKPDFLKEVAPFDPLTKLPELTTQHVRLQQTLDDPFTPVSVKKKLAAAIPHGAEVAMYDTTAQFISANSQGLLFEWTKGIIRPRPVTPVNANAGKAEAGSRQDETSHDD